MVMGSIRPHNYENCDQKKGYADARPIGSLGEAKSDEYDDEYDDEREYERDRRPMLYYKCFLYRPFVFVRAPCVDDWGRSAARIELFLNLFVFLIQIEVATGWSYK